MHGFKVLMLGALTLPPLPAMAYHGDRDQSVDLAVAATEYSQNTPRGVPGDRPDTPIPEKITSDRSWDEGIGGGRW